MDACKGMLSQLSTDLPMEANCFLYNALQSKKGLLRSTVGRMDRLKKTGLTQNQGP